MNEFVNGYFALKNREVNGLVDFTIIYMSSSNKFKKVTKYYSVDTEKYQKVKTILQDYISYNRKQEEKCRTISLFEVIMMVDTIVYDE